MTIDRRHLAAALALSAMTLCAASGIPSAVSAHPTKSVFASATTAVPEHRVSRLKRLRRHQERKP